MTDFAAASAAIHPELVALRRELHQIPEIGLQLPQTQAAVLRALEGLPLEITLGTRTTSVTAVLRGGRPGPAVLLRGDMDALPVVEATGLPYASTNGAMHACGHDLHTAGLVGAARLLSAVKDELPGSVVFMFQPGEEGYNGASVMIDEGVLDAAGERVVAAFGVHVLPGALGTVELKGGPLMASSNELRVTVTGAGGHGSQPHKSKDPVPVLAEIVLGLQSMVTRRFDVFDPVVLTVTQLQAGTAVNVIPPQASLGATVRSLSQESLDLLEESATRLAEGIAAAHGLTAEATLRRVYPVTVNDAAEADFVAATVVDLFGAERLSVLAEPHMGAEDFSFVLRQVPGTFAFFGTTPEGMDPETMPSNHSPLSVFDDSRLGEQAALLAELAWRRLAAATAAEALSAAQAGA